MVSFAMLLMTTSVVGDETETININQSPLMLTVEDFDRLVVDKQTSKVKEGKPWFIKFYAPWCGHCKKLAPTWEEFHQKHGSEINVAKVDCTNEDSNELCAQFGIRGYPTLMFLKEGKAYTFRK